MYRATIIGKLWLGGEAHTNVPIIAATVEDAQRKAEHWSDFDGVLDYELVEITSCPCCHANTVKNVVRPWVTSHPELTDVYD